MKATVLHSLNRIKRGLIVFVLLAICNPEILAVVFHYEDSCGIDYLLDYDTREAQVIESGKNNNPPPPLTHDIEPSGDIIIKDTIHTINGPFPVKYVGKRAFANCEKITSVSFPKAIISIDADAFHGCTGLTSITIPNSCRSIGQNAFYECTELISISISDSCRSIGNLAFYKCSKLTEIVIPNSVENIGAEAFYYCDQLKSVHITDVASWCNIKFDNALSNPFYSSTACSLYLNGEKVTELIIPNSVTTINKYAFYDYDELIKVTISNSVTSINHSAFGYCNNLTNVILSEQLRSIGTCAFQACTKLASITIPSSVESINYDTFAYCDNLEYIKVDEGNTVYDSRGDCNAIIETNSNTLVRGGKSTIIPESVVNIGRFAFNSVLGLEKINIPQSVTSIGYGAFLECSNLTSINLPNLLTEIQDDTFAECYSLTDITIPENVTNIGQWAFQSCQSLTDITIPKNVTNIGYGAFTHCRSLANIYCLSDFPPTAHEHSFEDSTYSNAILWVPIGFEYLYQIADGWTNFKHINIDPNSVKELNKTAIKPTEIYDINGRPCTSMDKPGIYIIRMSDGSIRKIKSKSYSAL